jgi:hypothetical protein
MNLKLRLERLCDFRAWVQFNFADGTTITGRILRIGHDYAEIESYGEPDRAGVPEYSKHVIPLGLIKFITIESPRFAEAERRRLDYVAHMDLSPDSVSEMEK